MGYSRASRALTIFAHVMHHIFSNYHTRTEESAMIMSVTHNSQSREFHAIIVEAVLESYLNVGGICCLVL